MASLNTSKSNRSRKGKMAAEEQSKSGHSENRCDSHQMLTGKKVFGIF